MEAGFGKKGGGSKGGSSRIYADLEEFEELLEGEEVSPDAFAAMARKLGKTRKARRKF